jgi:hypothetical protein
MTDLSLPCFARSTTIFVEVMRVLLRAESSHPSTIAFVFPAA